MTRRLQAAAALLLAFALPAAAESSFNDAQKAEIGQIVRDYLLANPEILLELSQTLDAKQKEAEAQQREVAMAANADQIFRSPHDHVAGNPQGDVTIVEFFDYNCSWCKTGFSEVVSLIEQDKNLRVVLKEFPIFGGDSDYAARAAVDAAPLVLAEINARMPRTHGNTAVPLDRVTAWCATDRDLPEHVARPVSETAARIGDHVAALIEDRAQVEIEVTAVVPRA